MRAKQCCGPLSGWDSGKPAPGTSKHCLDPWPDTGLKTSQVIGNRHPELAALVEESALATAVDALLEHRPYERPGPSRRPQVLFTLPNAQT